MFSLFTEEDIYLFKEGNHFRLYEKFGAHTVNVEGTTGTYFAVWMPNAKYVSVIGNFNNWDKRAHSLTKRKDFSGIWEGFFSGVGNGEIYKYFVHSKNSDYQVDKSDPYGFFWELSPHTATITWDLEYRWGDAQWMKSRKKTNSLQAPISIYEVHPGSWKRVPDESNRSLSYRELAHALADYVKEMGFSHVEFLPVMEHPFYGSWGYQTQGYFAPTSRYGNPQDFMYLIDYLHQNNIGVILDWVPSHFPSDIQGLVYEDGTHLYEYPDANKGFQPEWKTYIFNYARKEVREFLISNAFFWLDKYHIDGLRMDAVASMLYLDYSREEGKWEPNIYGGKENLEAIGFLKKLNEKIYKNFPDVQLIAEESTAWPLVSSPVDSGGLGFGMKWNMGWMHDTLEYMSKDSVYRKYHYDHFKASFGYAFTENFILSLSHDEMVYGKRSLLNKMPGDDWHKFANLRLLYGYMYTYPGKKLLFMGSEFGQWNEWNHEQSLDWGLLQDQRHEQTRRWVSDLNHFYGREKALYESDFSPEGFSWIEGGDRDRQIISFLRRSRSGVNVIMAVCNFTPFPQYNYRIGVPFNDIWQEVLNSDAKEYGGSGEGNSGSVKSESISFHGMDNSIAIVIPPFSIIIFKHNMSARQNL
jgi:1,4-alpha-glucan branching enzyme